MRTKRRYPSVSVGGLAALAAGIAAAQSSAPDTPRWEAIVAAPVTDAVLVEPDPADWLFWGGITQVLRAFDAESGEILWESEPLGATVQTSTITYAVDGRQHIAVINGEPLLGARWLANAAGLALPDNRGNSVNVFALPER